MTTALMNEAVVQARTGETILISADDLPKVEGHKWRVINGIPCTVELSTRFEVKVPLLNFLQNKHRSIPLATVNGDPLDCRRENWQSDGNTNIYRKVDSRTVELTVDGVWVLVDEDMAYYLTQFNWKTTKNKAGGIAIWAFEPGSSDRVYLARYLTKAPPHSKIRHRNNDFRDFRLENLEVYY